jgi:hypothetical protein
MISQQFPTYYDVRQTMRFRTTPALDLRRFTQGIGIIVSGNGKDDISEFSANLLLEYDHYISLRNLAYGGRAAPNISGFSLRSAGIPIQVDTLLDDIVKLREQLISDENSNGNLGEPLLRLGMPQMINNTIRVTFQYQRVIPGRVELLERVETEIDVSLEPITKSEWRLICYPEANSDVKMVEELFGKIGNKSYEASPLTLEYFTKEQRIQYFDAILDYYRNNSEWELLEVVGLTVRQQQKADAVPLTLEDGVVRSVDTEQEVGRDDLLSITQAVLEGRNLRNNSFVKNCERQGFYFPSMTLLLTNRKTPEIVEVTIRFKLVPRLFEVVLTEMRENTEMGEELARFTLERQREILREFWTTSNMIWKQVDAQTAMKRDARQMTLAEGAAGDEEGVGTPFTSTPIE